MSDFLVAEGNLTDKNGRRAFGILGTKKIRRTLVRIFHSTTLRLAVLYIVALGVSALVLSFLLWYSTTDLLDRQLESTIRFEAQSMAEHYGHGGLEELSSTVRERLADNADDHALYLLVDHDGNRIAGNLDLWPSRVISPHAWYRVPLTQKKNRLEAIYRFYPLPSGYRLLLGRDTKNVVQLRAILREGMFLAASVAVIVAFISAFLIRRLFKRAMANLSDIAKAIGNGDMTSRVKLRGAADEFDEIGSTFNRILDLSQKLMDGVRQVTDAVAHDLRTPIARARARLESAMLPKNNPNDWLRAIEETIDDLDNINKIFQSILRISEVEAGARRSAFENTNLSILLAGLVELFETTAEEQDIKFRNQWEESLYFFCDQQMLQQALVNLLDNALKFSPKHSTISLCALLDQDSILISVADQGHGIPASDREKAVQRFYRADEARHTPGSGLGLPLVAAVAELHNGKLRLEDNAPGLKATLALPLVGNKQTPSKGYVHHKNIFQTLERCH